MDSQHELSLQAGVDIPPQFAQSPDGTGGDSGNLGTLAARLSLQPDSQEDSSTREMETNVSELLHFNFEDTTRLSKRMRDQVIAVWALVRIFSGPNSTVVRNTQADNFGWRSFRVRYDKPGPESDIEDEEQPSVHQTLAKLKPTKWMDKTYEVHTRLEEDMFKKMICSSVWAPEQIYDWDPSRRYWMHRNSRRSQGEGVDGEEPAAEELRLYEDVMSTDWAYDEYTKIYDSDPTLEQGITLVPILLYNDGRPGMSSSHRTRELAR